MTSPQKSSLTRRQENGVRENILHRAAQYPALLDAYIRGELRDKDGNPVELSASKLKSIEMMLSRAVPVLQATELSEVNSPSGMGEGELKGRLVQLIREDPELVAQVTTAVESETNGRGRTS